MANDKLKQNFKDIANSIRAKTGKNGTIKAEEMSAEIDSIPVGIEPEGTKEIRNNGDFNIREFENVHVDVPGATTKELFEANANGTYDIAEYANVKVDVPNPSTGTKDIVANGNYDVTAFANANVNVPDQTYTPNRWYPTNSSGEIREQEAFAPDETVGYSFYHNTPTELPSLEYGCAYYIHNSGMVLDMDFEHQGSATQLNYIGDIYTSEEPVIKFTSSNYHYEGSPVYCRQDDIYMESLSRSSVSSGGLYTGSGYGSGNYYYEGDDPLTNATPAGNVAGLVYCQYPLDYYSSYGGGPQQLSTGWYIGHQSSSTDYSAYECFSEYNLGIGDSVEVTLDEQTFTITRTA